MAHRSKCASPTKQIGQTKEKWILREACKDLLPHDLVWREKAQFDERTGTVGALDEALAIATGAQSPVDRATEAQLYHDILLDQFEDPQILQNAGTWAHDRIPPRTDRTLWYGAGVDGGTTFRRTSG